MLTFLKRHGWQIFGAIAVCLALSPFLLLSAPFAGPILGDCPNLEATGYLKLPPSVKKVTHITQHGGKSCTIFLRFQTSPQELNDFVDSTLIKSPLTSTLPTSSGGIEQLEKSTGWKVTISAFLAGENQQGLESQFIIVDTSQQAFYTVYVVTRKDWL